MSEAPRARILRLASLVAVSALAVLGPVVVAVAEDAAPLEEPPPQTSDTGARPDDGPPASPDAVQPGAETDTGTVPSAPETLPRADTETPLTAEPSEPALPVSPPGPPPEQPPALPPEPARSAASQKDVPPAPPAPAAAPVAPSPTSWSFSLSTGYYQPRLGTLNRILRDTGITILQDPNYILPRNQFFTFEQRNLAVAELTGGVSYGVNSFYNAGGAHSFGLSFSSWRRETIGKDAIRLFLRSNVDPITAPRSARYNLILDQIFLEWRYHLLRSSEGRGVYVNVGLVGVTLAFLTMDALVNAVDNSTTPPFAFASVSSDESFGWGYTTRFGVGGDYPLTSWLSIGGRANYVLGTIRQLTVTRHFEAGFPQFPISNPLSVRPGVPLPQLVFPPRDGVPVQYATVTTTGEIQENVGTERDLTLELSGWEGLLELTVRF